MRAGGAGEPRLVVVLLLLAALALIPFVPAIVQNEVLTFRDHADYFHPLRHFTAESLRTGQLPVWNHHNGAGERWMANPQTGVFYPPAWVHVVVPYAIASSLFLAFHVALFGVSSFLLFRRFASAHSSTAAAVALMLSGPSLSLLDVSNNLATLAWVPLVLSCGLDREWHGRYVIRDSAVIALSFLAGEPLLAAAGALLYAVLVFTDNRRAPGRPRGSRVWESVQRVVAVAALSVAFVLPQLTSFVEALAGSDRSAGLPADIALRNSVHPRDWLMLIVPQLSETGRDLTPHLSQQFIPSMFVPLSIIAAAIIGLVTPAGDRESRARWLFVSLGAAAALVATGGYLPGMSGAGDFVFRYPARFIPFVALALCALAAVGFDRLQAPTLPRVRRTLTIVVIVALALSAMMRTGVGEHRMIVYGIAIDAVIAVLFLLVAQRHFRGAMIALMAVSASLLISSAIPFFEHAALAELRAPYAPLLDPRQRVARVFDTSTRGYVETLVNRNMMSGYRNLFERQFDVSTAAPVIDQRYGAIHDLTLTKPRLDLVDFLSVRYLISERDLPPTLYRLALRIGKVKVYENTHALPAVTLWSDVRPASSDEDAIRKTLAARGDELELFAAEHPLPGRATVLARGAAVVHFPSPAIVEARVDARERALVVLNHLDARGWRVTVDGAAASTVRVAGVFRGVVVDAGKHEIVWTYRSPYFTFSLLVSLVAISFCAAWAARATAIAHRR